MNELSQEALYNLIYSAISFGDSLFELWLTVTFAAILAVYFSSERIDRLMRNLLVGLYSVSSILLTGRWIVAMSHYVYYQEVISSSGFAPLSNALDGAGHGSAAPAPTCPREPLDDLFHEDFSKRFGGFGRRMTTSRVWRGVVRAGGGLRALGSTVAERPTRGTVALILIRSNGPGKRSFTDFGPTH